VHRHTLTLVSSILAFAAAGCRDGGVARDTTPVVDRDSSAPGAVSLWYHRTRSLDLTGDGRPDTIALDADGTRPDSMRITLRLIVDGSTRYRETWGSSYELALLDSAVHHGARADSVLRSKLDSVLASVTVSPLDAPGVRLMAEDSAVLAGLDARPSRRVSFSYGYETTVRLVWDATGRRFVKLWSCC
jgi:hypothetical protein